MLKNDFMLKKQNEKDKALLDSSKYLGQSIESKIIPFSIDLKDFGELTASQRMLFGALEIKAARIAISSLASLAKINELDHLGGGLDLISALVLTFAVTDFENIQYTIENAHTSIGYYAVLSAYGFLEEKDVVEKFRRGLDIPGHVSWLPGGTQLNGGRLGVMIPVAVGQALGMRAKKGQDAWVITHCGDAGWISGQALNGFNAADLQQAPVTFIMHRNGIQLSGSTRQMMDKDPRPIINSLGIQILEIPSLHEVDSLAAAYKEAYALAGKGIPSLIYPVGFSSTEETQIDLNWLGDKYGITLEIKEFAKKNNVSMNTKIWIPGSLMSYRDIEPMLECIFLVNDLAGGKGHHDGHMKGRDEETVRQNAMLTYSYDQATAWKKLLEQPQKSIVTTARPKPGSANLVIPSRILKAVKLPEAGKSVSPRAGVDTGYATVAASFPEQMFVVSCDLDASTKLGTAKKYLPQTHTFEMSIQEQVAALLADGLAMSSSEPQLNVFSTFAAFFEGIAREGFEMWRYQRNLNGINEGLNVTFHLSHVGACTGRDHFSGWSLDWINLAIGYLPYLHRFYAPADARAAFLAVRDLAAHYGGHIIGIPRDNLPILTKPDGKTPLWEADNKWEAVTLFRSTEGANKAILVMGAPAFIAEEAFKQLETTGHKTDVYIINGLPFSMGQLPELLPKYTNGIVTVEDGLIGTNETGIRGFAGIVAGAARDVKIPAEHIGIRDPRVAPSDGHMEVWEHFGLTSENIVKVVEEL
jgi:transketolase N-terminal domain/subunit/transketolase C-terminal domain/subunit